VFDTTTEQFEVGSIDLTQFEGCTIDLFIHGTDVDGVVGPSIGYSFETGNCTAPTPLQQFLYFPAVFNQFSAD